MKFKFSFKIHSDLLSNGTRYITDIPGLLAVKAQNNTLGFLFEFKDNPRWVYVHSNKLVTGWNEVSLDGNDTKIILTVNSNTYTLIDQSATYDLITYTGGYNKNVYLSNIAPLNTANSWEIRTVYTYNGGASYPLIFGSNDNTPWSVPFMHVFYAYGDQGWGNYICTWACSDGYGSDIIFSEANIGLMPSLGSTYYLKLMYNDSTGYSAYYSTTDFTTGTTTPISSSTTKVASNSVLSFLNSPNVSSEYYSEGSINLTETKIIINGSDWFNGYTAIENTDYTNNGCTESRETIYPKGQYPVIHTGRLETYQSWLYLKDIEALKLDD